MYTYTYICKSDYNECVFHRPVALTLPMSVSIDIRGEGGSPTLTTSRRSVYSTETGSTDNYSITNHPTVMPMHACMHACRHTMFY